LKKEEIPMVEYDLFFFCDECNESHPAGIKISLKEGPIEKQSICAFYAGRELPPQIEELTKERVLCPKTGKIFTQDLDRIYLVPIS
jgi:hypothetical protein